MFTDWKMEGIKYGFKAQAVDTVNFIPNIMNQQLGVNDTFRIPWSKVKPIPTIELNEPEQPILPMHQIQFKGGEITGRVGFEATTAVLTEGVGEAISAFKGARALESISEIAYDATYKYGIKDMLASEKGGIGGKGFLTPKEMNKFKSIVSEGTDIEFATKDQAVNFIKNKFGGFPEEVAGGRSAQGWHFDSHSINGSADPIEHINLYSKEQGFRVHITWRK